MERRGRARGRFEVRALWRCRSTRQVAGITVRITKYAPAGSSGQSDRRTFSEPPSRRRLVYMNREKHVDQRFETAFGHRARLAPNEPSVRRDEEGGR